VARSGWSLWSLLAAVAVALPVAMLAVSVLAPDTEMWRQQWATRLPGQLVATAILLAGVATGTVVVGSGLAWLLTAYHFPGSRVLSWLLILPLAMPSYILGFLALSVLGFTGPVQGAWRSLLGTDAWFPDVASLPGAILAFTLVLYPYVYLMARAALRDQAGGAYNTARVLGASPLEAARRVVFPLIRPAVAAGAAVVAMETLTDFATVTYFDVDTVSVGVFRIWRGTFDRNAASELSTLVLVLSLVVIGLERSARGRARFGEAGGAGAGVDRVRLRGPAAWSATATCAVVVVAAFIGPATQLAVWAVREQIGPRGTPLTDRYLDHLGNSLVLAAATVAVCVTVAVVLASARRFGRPSITRLSTRIAAVGYAVPGPVVGIGVVLATVGADRLLGGVGLGLPGAVATGSFATLVYAYSVRFLTPSLNAVEAGLEQVGDEVTASARTLGARPATVVRRLHLPLSRASIGTAAVLVGVDAIKELPIVLLLRPFGFDTLPVWVYNLASESRYPQAALPALSIVAVALVPVVLVSRQLERGGS
jgi:iron(III) transport system permease protein